MPMSSSRLMASAALPAWNELSMSWPVSEACSATSAVAASRISPIMITSGSCRSTLRNPSARSKPAPALTCDWATPGIAISIGSSSVTMLRAAGDCPANCCRQA